MQRLTKDIEWLDWVEHGLVPYLFPGIWYNGNPNYNTGFVADNEPSRILAMARFRQMRVKKGKIHFGMR